MIKIDIFKIYMQNQQFHHQKLLTSFRSKKPSNPPKRHRQRSPTHLKTYHPIDLYENKIA